ncbi:MAG: hypothetical protein V1495_07730 [Pseudomonadota bacterium]
MPLRSRWKAILLDQGLLWAVLILLAHDLLRDLIRTPVLGGWDGASHLAMATDYSSGIWPSVFGWTPHWYLGMPFPNFYHPLFFWFVAALDHLLPFSVSTDIKLLGLFLSFTLPTLIYFLCWRHLGGRQPALIAGILTLFQLLRTDNLSGWGLTLIGTFRIGLYAHLLALWLLLLLFFFLPGAATRRRDRWISTGLLTLVLLANVNTLLPLLLTFAAFSVTQRSFRPYLAVGVVSLALSAFWYVPMLDTYAWVATKPLPVSFLTEFRLEDLTWIVLGAISIFLAFRRRQTFALATGGGAAAALLLVPTASIVFAGTPFQSHRVVITAFFLMIPLLAFGISTLLSLPKTRHLRFSILALLLALFLAYPYSQEPDEFYPPVRIARVDPADYSELLPLGNRPAEGRFTVELVDYTKDDYGLYDEAWYLNGLLGNEGGYGIATVYREASISAFFADPLRNVYSESRPSIFGVDSQLAADPDFLNQPWPEQRKRNRLLNLKRIFVHKRSVVEALGKAKGYRKVAATQRWTVFEDQAAISPYGHIPEFQPVLVYADWEPKRRASFGGYDFLSLAEFTFLTNRSDPPLVFAPESRIDGTFDAEPFGGVLVTAYRYRNLESACDRLARWSRTKPVLLLNEGDPLVACVVKRGDPTRVIVLARPYRSPDTERTLRARNEAEGGGSRPLAETFARLRNQYRISMGRILDAVTKARIPVAGDTEVRSVEIGRNETRVTLDRNPERPVPVVVHQSYFPRWFSGVAPVLFTTPCYQLIFADRRETTLTFRRTWVEHGAAAVSGLVFVVALVAAGVGWFRRRKTKNDGSPP